MPVTDYLMKVGDWSLNLNPETPMEIRDRVKLGSALLLTKSRILDYMDRTPASLAGLSVYAGVLTSREQERVKLAGKGLLWFVQTGKGHGFAAAGHGAIPASPATFTQIMQSFFSFGYSNGLAYGTGYSATATTVTGLDPNSYLPPLKPVLDTCAARTGNEYKVNPDGTVDWGISTALFQSTPTVLIAPGMRGRDINVTALEVARWNVREDIDDYRTGALGQDNTGAYRTIRYASIFDYYTVGEYLTPAGITTLISPPLTIQSANTGEVDAQLDAAAVRYAGIRQTITCSVNEYCIPQLITPGDWVYVYDPASDVIDSANVVQFQGQTLYPDKVRCYGTQWPIEAGPMGVYLVDGEYDSDGDITDITDWVVPESGPTRLDIAAAPRSLIDTFDRSLID